MNMWEASDRCIVMEFPSNKHEEVERALDLIVEAGRSNLCRLSASITVDGETGQELIERWGDAHPRLFLQMCDFSRIEGEKISMTHLRMEAMKATKHLNLGDWSLVMDGDMVTREGWAEFVIDTIEQLPSSVDHAGIGMWVNFRGMFGSAGPGDRLMVPRQLPLGSNLGILITPRLRDQFLNYPPPCYPSGCEDPLFTTWFTLVNKAIPFRRFKTPAHHPKKSTDDYEQSYIHDNDEAARFNFRLMNELWEEARPPKNRQPKWAHIPRNMDESGKVTEKGIISPNAPWSGKFVEAMIKHRIEEEGLDHLRGHINWRL